MKGVCNGKKAKRFIMKHCGIISMYVVSLSKKLYPHWLVHVGSRHRFERDFTN